MAESGWLRHALGIGVFEFRRSVRTLWQDKARFTLMALGILFPSLVVTVLAVVFADAIRGVEAMPVPDMVRGMIALFWLFGVFLVTQRVVSARTRIEAESLMLTTVSARTVAGGLLAAEILRVLAYIGFPTLLLTGVAVFLLGSPASLILIPMTALFAASTVATMGAIVGYAIAWLVATSRFVARHKTVLGTAGTLLGMGGYFLFFYPQIGGVNQAALAWFPMGWFADLAVIGTRFGESVLQAMWVVVGSVVLLVGGGIIIERETVALWFTEPVSPDTENATQESEHTAKSDDSRQPARGDPLAAAVKPLTVPKFVPTPIRRVAEWVLLRTRRDPNRLMFLMIPVFAIGSPLVSTGVQSGSIGAVAAPLSAVGLPWLVGSLFAMNPLGDEEAVLPVTLTAVSGNQYVRGLMVPGLVFGLPIVVIAAAIAGIVSPYSTLEQLGLVGLGVYLTGVSVTITPAIGMTFPRFSTVSIGQSQDVLPPRMSAVAIHAALTVIPGGLLAALLIAPNTARAVLAGLFGFLPAILLELLSSSTGLLAGVSGTFSAIGQAIQEVGLMQLQIIGGATVLTGGVFVSVLLYRKAILQFKRYTPP